MARSVIGALVLSTVLSGALRAQDSIKTRSFVGDLGFLSASGNTSVSTLNVGNRFVANTRDKRVIFTQTLGAVYGKTDSVKTAENYRGQLRLDYQLSGKLYLFGLTGWDRNTFGGISRRFEETMGLAYKAVSLPNDELGLEVGLSLFQQRNVTAVNNSFDDNFKAGRAAGFYKHVFSKTTFFSQVLELIPNFDTTKDWRLNSESAVVAPISTNVGLKLGYVIRFDNLPDVKPLPNPTSTRFKKTDRFFTVGLSFSY
jgi:putative salt-induced outer membrane protein